MTSAVCCVARYENDYLPEWIKYHLDLGFNKVILYDNNNPDDLSIYSLLKEYGLEDQVEVIDYRGRKSFQLEAYNTCHSIYGNDYDWIAYIDADVIVVNWMIYGDNGYSVKTPGRLVERFLNPNPIDNAINWHVKSIIRTGTEMKFVRNPHCVDGDLRVVDDCFNKLNGSEPFKQPSYRKLYIRHYNTKTIEEFIKVKIGRGAADVASNASLYNLSLFYRDNKRTKEKRKVERKLCPFKTVLKMDIICFLQRLGLSELAMKIKV